MSLVDYFCFRGVSEEKVLMHEIDVFSLFNSFEVLRSLLKLCKKIENATHGGASLKKRTL